MTDRPRSDGPLTYSLAEVAAELGVDLDAFGDDDHTARVREASQWCAERYEEALRRLGEV